MFLDQHLYNPSVKRINFILKFLKSESISVSPTKIVSFLKTKLFFFISVSVKIIWFFNLNVSEPAINK